jgi:hypothetical protein
VTKKNETGKVPICQLRKIKCCSCGASLNKNNKTTNHQLQQLKQLFRVTRLKVGRYGQFRFETKTRISNARETHVPDQSSGYYPGEPQTSE